MLDRLILAVDRGLRTIAAPARSVRHHPDRDVMEPALSDAERRLAVSLMRVNHTGEVCAQALYQGQALTARDQGTRETLEQAAREETDHLAWTESRIESLGGRKSLLNPIFYAGSFALGALSGLAGDRWNLGFLAETERQVEGHLTDHLERLPAADTRSRAVLEAMRTDEIKHAQAALAGGGAPLPLPVQAAMRLASRIMTGTTSRI
ncbi:MAG: 2-polyprenyl-3-methyl-6-methoxy-1,4-benzoquinone monooxygenase [Burkholderiales bacterium]